MQDSLRRGSLETFNIVSPVPDRIARPRRYLKKQNKNKTKHTFVLSMFDTRRCWVGGSMYHITRLGASTWSSLVPKCYVRTVLIHCPVWVSVKVPLDLPVGASNIISICAVISDQSFTCRSFNVSL